MKNSNLHKAKNEKNNEFYTQLTDIEKELQHYKEHFKDKVVYCNCDDHRFSNFYRYFSLNFEFLGLKKLIATHFSSDGIAYKLEIIRDINGDGRIDELDTIETALKQNGDFRSDECIEILKEADIVVSNPPFSLFREYISQLNEYNKQFLVIGSMNAITYKDCFSLIKDNKMWLGCSGRIVNFEVPISNFDSSRKDMFLDNNKAYQKLGNVVWFTNIPHKKRNEEIILYKTYNEQEYPKYDNYNAINVDKTKDIPCDYFGAIGVPISFLDKYNPKQFEVIGISANGQVENNLKIGDYRTYNNPFLGSRKVYQRLFIKRK